MPATRFILILLIGAVEVEKNSDLSSMLFLELLTMLLLLLLLLLLLMLVLMLLLTLLSLKLLLLLLLVMLLLLTVLAAAFLIRGGATCSSVTVNSTVGGFVYRSSLKQISASSVSGSSTQSLWTLVLFTFVPSKETDSRVVHY